MANVTVNGTNYTGITEVRLPVTNTSGSEQRFVLPPSGTKNITANGNGIDVSEYAAVNVNVPVGSTPSLQQKSVTAPASGTTAVTPDSSYDGLSRVTVSPTPTETKSITANGTYTPTTGKHFSQVTVNVSSSAPSTQEKTVTPTASTQTVTPDSGKLLSKVTVNGDADLVASNIKSGVNIFGVTGSYTGSGSGANLQTKTVTPTTSQQNVTPDSGYDGLSRVTVNAISTETKSVTPSASAQTITPSSGKYLTSVSVAGDARLIAANIKKGVTIFGITGTYEGTGGGSGSSNANISTLEKTLTAAASSIQFTGLAGEPTSFAVISESDLATGASPYKTADVVFDGTNVFGQYITNTNNAQMTYSASAFTKSYSGGTLTITGSGTNFQANKYLLIYTYGGSTSDVLTKTATVGSGATSISFTGLTAQPRYFSCILKGGNIGTASGYTRAQIVVSDGESISGLQMGSGSQYSSTAWTANYANGTLTLSSASASNGGYFHQGSGFSYQLTYVI